MDTREHRVVLFAAIITCAGGIPLSRTWPSPATPKWPQASLFPPYPWHGVNWSSEEKSIIWMDGLSGDGPIERHSHQPVKRKSSSEIFIHTPTATQIEDYPDFSIDTVITDSDDNISGERVVRSSFSFDGPSSLLNTFIFRPTTPTAQIEYTPTPSLPISYTDEIPVHSYHWSSYERQSRSRESREIPQSEESTPLSTTYIVTAISATHVYEWSSKSDTSTYVSDSTRQTSLNIQNLSNWITTMDISSQSSFIIQGTSVIPTKTTATSNTDNKENESSLTMELKNPSLTSSFTPPLFSEIGRTHHNHEMSSINIESQEYVTKTHVFTEIRDSVLSPVKDSSYRTKKIESYISATESNENVEFSNSITEIISQNEVESFSDIFSKIPETSATVPEMETMLGNITVSYISGSFHSEITPDFSANQETLSTTLDFGNPSTFQYSTGFATNEITEISSTKSFINTTDIFTYIEPNPVSETSFSITDRIPIEPSQMITMTPRDTYDLLSSFVMSQNEDSISDHYTTYSFPLKRNFSTFLVPTTVDYYFTSEIDSIFISIGDSVVSNALSLQLENLSSILLTSRTGREILETSMPMTFSSNVPNTRSLNLMDENNSSIILSFPTLHYSSSTDLMSSVEIDQRSTNLLNLKNNSKTVQVVNPQPSKTAMESSMVSFYILDSESTHHIIVRSEPYSIEGETRIIPWSESTINTHLLDISSYTTIISPSSVSAVDGRDSNIHVTESFSDDSQILESSLNVSLTSTLVYKNSSQVLHSLECRTEINVANSDFSTITPSQLNSFQTSLMGESYGTSIYPLSSMVRQRSYVEETVSWDHLNESSILTLDPSILSVISKSSLITRQAVLYTTSTDFDYPYSTLYQSIKSDDISSNESIIYSLSSSSIDQKEFSYSIIQPSFISISFYATPSPSINISSVHQSTNTYSVSELTQHTLLPEFSKLYSSEHSGIKIPTSTVIKTENTVKNEELSFGSLKISDSTKLFSPSERHPSLSIASQFLDLSSSFENSFYTSATSNIHIASTRTPISSLSFLDSESTISEASKFPYLSLSGLGLHTPTVAVTQLSFHPSSELSSSMDSHLLLKSHEMESTVSTTKLNTISYLLSCSLPSVLEITSSHFRDLSKQPSAIPESDYFTNMYLHSSVVDKSYTYNWSKSFTLSNMRSDFSSTHSPATHLQSKSNSFSLHSSFTTSKSVITPTLIISHVGSETLVGTPLPRLESTDAMPHPKPTPSKSSFAIMSSSFYYPQNSEDTTPSDPLDRALMNKNYWILTVLEAPLNHELPENFSHTMELRLANAYSEAFRSYRSKREDSGLNRLEFVIVKILSLTNNLLLNQLEMIYVVERGGELVPASSASATLDILRHDQLRGYLGHNVIIKATPYEPEKRATIVQHTPTTPTSVIVGSIIGALLALLLLICIYFRCCRSKTVVASATSSASGSLQRSLSAYGQHNRKQIFQEVTHYIGTEGEGHLEKGQMGPPMKPVTSNIPISGRHLPKLPQIPTDQPTLPPSRAKKKPQRVDVGTLTVSDEIHKPKRDEGKRQKKTSDKDNIAKPGTDLHSNGVSSETSKFPSKPELEKNEKSEDSLLSTSESNGSSSPTSTKTDSESASDGSNTALLPTAREHMAAKTKSEGEAQVAATQQHLARVRQRISELLDDAFAMAGAQRVGSSLRNKRVNPSSDSFPRFNSLRSPQRSHSEMAQRYALNESDSRLLSSSYRPSSTGGGQQLLGALTDDGKLEILPVPKVVWSKGSSGDETEDAKSLNSETLDARISSGRSCRETFRARSATFRPSSSLPVLDALDELSSPDVFAAPRTLQGAASDHQLPYSSRMNPAVLDQYDEIDVINALKEGEPIAAIIQAIKDELQKFNNSLPGTNTNESSA